MGLALLRLAGGLVALLIGGDLFVRAAAGLARRLGVPPVAVGMTVVAFGTSTPELVVSFLAAREGHDAIAFGNVVGSNIANVGLLLAASALLRPLAVHRSIVTRDIPMLLLSCGAALALCSGTGRLDRPGGAVLLLLFAVFLYYTVAGSLRARDPFAEEAGVHGGRPLTVPRAAALLAAGLLGTIGGGHLAVTGAVALARAAAVPEGVIALTLVAVGTSLPELAVSVVAARRGESDLAVGNLVGSNLFNLLFILGGAAVLAPLRLPDHGRADLVVMTGFAAVLLPLALTQRRISRAEGGLLLAGYAGYCAWLALR